MKISTTGKKNLVNGGKKLGHVYVRDEPRRPRDNETLNGPTRRGSREVQNIDKYY